MHQKKKESLLKVLGSGFAAPKQLYSGSSLYISSKGLLQADGCKGVALYNENYIELNMGHCTARISGDNLTLLTLSPGTLSIEGRLFTIEFFYT